jgi:hypothetical protein
MAGAGARWRDGSPWRNLRTPIQGLAKYFEFDYVKLRVRKSGARARPFKDSQLPGLAKTNFEKSSLIETPSLILGGCLPGYETEFLVSVVLCLLNSLPAW